MSEIFTVRGRHYRTGLSIELAVENGVISAVRETESSEVEETDTDLPRIAPGLVDLQLNGCMGLDFNQSPIPADVTERISEALWRQGVTSYYPTVITNGDAEIEQAVRSISEACRRSTLVDLSVGGIHLEGPFISPHDGPRGAHGKAYVKAPNWELFQRWQEAADGRIRIITLSPEWPKAPDFIAKCAASGVTVSIGHTSASNEQILAAADAGARMSTHWGNGAHLMLPRHPNYLWEQLACDSLWTCVVADGFHLPDSVLKSAFRVKGERALIVSDAVYLCGMPPGEYETHVGGQVILTPEGRLHLAANPQLLAGSAQLLAWGIEHVTRSGLASLADAWDMASVRPATAMSLQASAGLQPGAPADLAIFRQNDDRIEIIKTYKQGRLVYDGAASEAN
nr:amidohydrolase family protein [Paenibacillus periandrae]